jgi:phage shock protein E
MASVAAAIRRFTPVLLVILVLWIYRYTFASPWLMSPEVARSLIAAKKIDIVLDVRTALERETLGLYPGSTHIPAGDLDRVVLDKFPDKGATILIYCNTGQRARRAVDTMRELGYKNVYYIAASHKALLATA